MIDKVGYMFAYVFCYIDQLLCGIFGGHKIEEGLFYSRPIRRASDMKVLKRCKYCHKDMEE